MKIVKILLIFLLILSTITVQGYNINATYQDLSSNEINFNQYSGKFLFVEAFATWCPHCQNEHSVLVQVWNQFNNSIQMLSLSTSDKDNLQTIQDYNKTYPTTWDLGFDNSHYFQNTYQIDGYPSMVLFNKNGNFAACFVGERDFNFLKQQITSFISNPNNYTQVNAGNGKCPSANNNLLSSPIVIIGSVFTLLVIIFYIIDNKRNRTNQNK